MNADNGRGKVFVYPFLNSSRTDENPWTNPFIIQPNTTLDNSHFGYKISESGNKVSISTFNQRTIYNYVINDLHPKPSINITTYSNISICTYLAKKKIPQKRLFFQNYPFF